MKTVSYGLETTFIGFGTCRYTKYGTWVKKHKKFYEHRKFEKVSVVSAIKKKLLGMNGVYQLGDFSK